MIIMSFFAKKTNIFYVIKRNTIRLALLYISSYHMEKIVIL